MGSIYWIDLERSMGLVGSDGDGDITYFLWYFATTAIVKRKSPWWPRSFIPLHSVWLYSSHSHFTFYLLLSSPVIENLDDRRLCFFFFFYLTFDWMWRINCNDVLKGNGEWYYGFWFIRHMIQQSCRRVPETNEEYLINLWAFLR